MNENRLAHIAQDACGLILRDGSSSWTGLVTDHVQTCVVYVFEGERGAVMCHDSGQMSIAGIAEVVSSLGPLSRLRVLKSTAHEDDEDRANQARRLSELCREVGLTGLDVDTNSTPESSFIAVYDFANGLRVGGDSLPTTTESPSDIDYRWAAAKLNNAFIPFNAQSLSGNLQFNGHNYLPAIGPVVSIEQIWQMVAQEPDFFFMNLCVLMRAHEQGVLMLPEVVLAFADAYGVTSEGSVRVADQQAAFHLFGQLGIL